MNKANECTCPSGDGSLVHPCPAHPAVEQAGANVGHGHVFPRADGVKMRCGGPGLCSECTADASRARAALAQPSQSQYEASFEEWLANELEGEDGQPVPAAVCDITLARRAFNHWPKLEQPAKVGSVRFSAGVSSRLVVEAAQRLCEFESTPEKEAERIERLQAFREQLDPLNLTPHAEAFNEAPAEALRPEQAEAKRPAVVGYRSMESGMVYEQDYGLKDPEALTTVAECDSIVGELRAVIAQLRQHKNDYMDSGQETYRALQNEIREREAEIARLDGLVSGRTAERDAALARVAELEKQERPEGPTDDELEAAGLGYPLHKEEAVKLWYSGFRSEVITVLEAWEAIGHDIGMNPDKGELLDSLRYMLEKCEAHDAALAEVAGLRSLLNSLLCYVERDIDRMRSDRDKSDNKEIYDRSISLAMERLKAAQNAVFTTEPGCDTAVELAAQTTQTQHSVPVAREQLERLVRILDAHNYAKDAEALMALLAAAPAQAQHSVPEGWMLVECGIWTQEQVDEMQKTVARFRNSEFVDNRALAMAVADAGQCKAPEISLAELLAAAPGNSAQHSVPEGLALIPVRETEAMHDAVMALLYKGVARTDTQKLLDAYIAAAPQPAGGE
ncbi:hypothetical protein JEZ77_01540 [Pseudomonas aeruginosa]|nr:hypothetical protein [Pseudomonas aeruginosa]